MPPLSRLKPFEATARHESLTLAAAEPGMTQTAVSKQIGQLERDLGTTLFVRRIQTNNPLERIMREIRRRTRVVGAFPDGQSALNLAAARLRQIAGTKWSLKRYMNMDLLKQHKMSA